MPAAHLELMNRKKDDALEKFGLVIFRQIARGEIRQGLHFSKVVVVSIP